MLAARRIWLYSHIFAFYYAKWWTRAGKLKDWQADRLTERHRCQCCKRRRHVTQSLVTLSHRLTPHSGIDSHYFFILQELYLNYKLKTNKNTVVQHKTVSLPSGLRRKVREGPETLVAVSLSICRSWLSKKKWNGSATKKSIYLSQFFSLQWNYSKTLDESTNQVIEPCTLSSLKLNAQQLNRKLFSKIDNILDISLDLSLHI